MEEIFEFVKQYEYEKYVELHNHLKSHGKTTRKQLSRECFCNHKKELLALILFPEFAVGPDELYNQALCYNHHKTALFLDVVEDAMLVCNIIEVERG